MATKTEKTVLDKTNFDGVLQLLTSSNQEDKVVGLHSIENSNFNNSIGAILLLYKRSELANSLWTENAPTVTKKLSGLGIKGDDQPTWTRIWNILIKNKYPVEQVQFVLDTLAQDMKKNMKEWGYDFMEDITINLTVKDEKQTGIPS